MATDIYYGTELWYASYQDTPCVLGDEGVQICQDTVCYIQDFNSTIIIGDIYNNGTSTIFNTVTIEGNLFSTGLFNFQTDVTVVGNLFVNGILSKTLNSTLIVKDCVLLTKNASLEIQLTPAELKDIQNNPSHIYSLINSSCFSANFSNIKVIVNNTCQQVVVSKYNYTGGLSASFAINDDACDQPIIIAVVVSIVGVILIAGIVLLAYPKTRNVIFPFRLNRINTQSRKEKIKDEMSKSSVSSKSSPKTKSDETSDKITAGNL